MQKKLEEIEKERVNWHDRFDRLLQNKQDLEEYLSESQNHVKFLEHEQEHSTRKIRQGYTLLLSYLMFVVVVAFLLPKILTFNLSPRLNTKTQTQNLTAQQNQINSLKKEVAELKKILNTGPVTDQQVKQMGLKIKSLDDNQKSINEALQNNPERVLSTVILQEKVANLKEDVHDLKASFDGLDERFYTLVVTVVVAPIAVLGLNWLIQKLTEKSKKSKSSSQ